MRQRFKDRQLQANYEQARAQGVPRAGSSIYCSYLAGLGVRGCPMAPRNSLAYAWWRAGRDNRDAKQYGARDVETLTRMGIALPYPPKEQ